jgi:hypothetical protein
MIVSFGVAKDAAAQRKVDFRFGSKADICSATAHVRFTPNMTSIAFFGMSGKGR